MYLIVSFEGDGTSPSSNTETKPGLISLQSGDNGLEQSNDMFTVHTHTDWCMAILYSCALFILYSLIHGVFISHSRKWCKKKPKKLIHLKIYIFHKHGNPLVSWCLNYQNGDQAPGSCAYLSKDDHAWLRFKSDCSETSIAVLFLPWLFLFLLLLGTNQQDSSQLQLVMYDAMISNHTRYSFKQYETG